MDVKSITVKLLVDADEEDASQVVMEMICEVFGKEERKDKPRAKLILIEVGQK